jgi:hypothetical protein
VGVKLAKCFGVTLFLLLGDPITGARAAAQSTYTSGEFFNFTNTERFAFPDLGVGSATFGEVTSTAPGSTPRHTQFGLKFQF